MNSFFRPTKVKVILTIIFFSLTAFYYAFFFLNWYGTTLISWCPPDIYDQPVPTPEPVSLSKTISDVTRIENPLPLGNYGDVLCMDDSSAQLAGHIVDISKIVAIVVYIGIIYLVICTIAALIKNSKKQKIQTVNAKK